MLYHQVAHTAKSQDHMQEQQGSELQHSLTHTHTPTHWSTAPLTNSSIIMKQIPTSEYKTANATAWSTDH